MNRRQLLQGVGSMAAGAMIANQPANGWLEMAESLKPALRETVQSPLSIVRPVADSSLFLRWRMEQLSPGSDLETRLLKKGDSFIVDFGGHRTGHLSFTLIGEGRSIDAPARLRLTFGEVPSNVAEELLPLHRDIE
jgi:alpha-L-rhamnosidase